MRPFDSEQIHVSFAANASRPRVRVAASPRAVDLPAWQRAIMAAHQFNNQVNRASESNTDVPTAASSGRNSSSSHSSVHDSSSPLPAPRIAMRPPPQSSNDTSSAIIGTKPLVTPLSVASTFGASVPPSPYAPQPKAAKLSPSRKLPALQKPPSQPSMKGVPAPPHLVLTRVSRPPTVPSRFECSSCKRTYEAPPYECRHCNPKPVPASAVAPSSSAVGPRPVPALNQPIPVTSKASAATSQALPKPIPSLTAKGPAVKAPAPSGVPLRPIVRRFTSRFFSFTS